MKTSIIFSDGVTQLIFTPENPNEQRALSYLNPEQQIDLAIIKNATFMDDRDEKPFAKEISMCRGGYLRTFSNKQSRMLVLKPKQKIDDFGLKNKIDEYLNKPLRPDIINLLQEIKKTFYNE